MLKNTQQRFGYITIGLHWLMAVAVLGLFFLGLYMSDLKYGDVYYHLAPWVHKSIGISVLATLIVRWSWHQFSPTPALLPAPVWEQRTAQVAHKLLYLLILLTAFAGYLLSTAKGHGVSVFDWFEVPALPAFLPSQEDLAGEIHEILAFTLMALVCAHAAAALKHHFKDKDNTLKRMLGR